MIMQIDNIITTLSIIGFTITVFYAMFRVSRYAFLLNIIMLSVFVFYFTKENEVVSILLYLVCPLMLINTGLYVFLHKTESPIISHFLFHKTNQSSIRSRPCSLSELVTV